MVVPLSGLHGGTTENWGAEEERSQFITAYRRGVGGVHKSSYEASQWLQEERRQGD